MAKSASPIRLQQTLMDAARVHGKLAHRSVAQQIEYWAELGRSISREIDPIALLEVDAGMKRIVLEDAEVPAVGPEEVFRAAQEARESGALSRAIAEASPVRYQGSQAHPGYLERIDRDGKVTVGTFANGAFHPRLPE